MPSRMDTAVHTKAFDKIGTEFTLHSTCMPDLTANLGRHCQADGRDV